MVNTQTQSQIDIHLLTGYTISSANRANNNETPIYGVVTWQESLQGRHSTSTTPLILVLNPLLIDVVIVCDCDQAFDAVDEYSRGVTRHATFQKPEFTC